MQFVFFLLTILLAAVAVFALQNAEPVTVRFLKWQMDSHVAAVIMIATAAGALIGLLLGLVARLARWRRTRLAGRAVREAAAAAELQSPTRPPSSSAP